MLQLYSIFTIDEHNLFEENTPEEWELFAMVASDLLEKIQCTGTPDGSPARKFQKHIELANMFFCYIQ